MKPKDENRVYCVNGKKSKLLFKSASKAKNFIKFNSQDIMNSSGYAPNRIYYCTSCGGWHITSSPIRKSYGKKSYTTTLLEDGWNYLIGYIDISLGKWGEELPSVSTTVNSESTLRDYWTAYASILKQEELTEDERKKLRSKVYWVVKSKDGTLLIKSKTGETHLLNQGEEIEVDFVRLSERLFYKDGIYKTLVKHE